MTLEALARKWFDQVVEQDYKPTTYENYKTTLGKWVFNEPKRAPLKVNWIKKNLDIPFDEISNSQWMDYFDLVCNEGVTIYCQQEYKYLHFLS